MHAYTREYYGGASPMQSTVNPATESTHLLMDFHVSSDETESSTTDDGTVDESQQSRLQLEEIERGEAAPETIENEEDQITTVLYSLHLLFYTLCMPSVPIFSMLLILLVQLVVTAATSPPCSYPLHAYSFLSLIVFTYVPCHYSIKKRFINNDQERENEEESGSSLTAPTTIVGVIYDQFFFLVCLTYVYLGEILNEACKENLILDLPQEYEEGISSCAASCPALYTCFTRFQPVLMILVTALSFPMLCFGFMYVLVMRKVVTSESLWTMNGGFGNGGIDLRGRSRGTYVMEIINSLREVVFVENEDRNKIRVIAVDRSASCNAEKLWDKNRTRECCICLNEFDHAGQKELCNGSELSDLYSCIEIDVGIDKDTDSSLVRKKYRYGSIVETRCGHYFHKDCISSWIGGEYWQNPTSPSGENILAKRRSCPLCRMDLDSTVAYTITV